jgi:hypothetical protein
VSQDDYVSCDRESERLLIPMVLLQANPSSSQLNAKKHADNEPWTEQDTIHACHCMSLPIASQNAQCYLQAGCGLACAMARAKMDLFAKALSLQFDHVEVCPLWFDHAEVMSLWFDHAEAV